MSEKWDAMPIALKLAENGCVIGSRIVKVIEDLEHAYAAGVASAQKGKVVERWAIITEEGDIRRELYTSKHTAKRDCFISQDERVVPVHVIILEEK